MSQGEFLLKNEQIQAMEKARHAKKSRQMPQLVYLFVFIFVLWTVIHQRGDNLRNWLSTKSAILLKAAFNANKAKKEQAAEPAN